jgi:ABC-type glycerol-3-phosphate transport system substrate-binding protein
VSFRPLRKIPGWRVLFIGAALFAILPPAGRADTASADGKIHVQYWEKWTSFEEQAMQAAIDAFNRSQDRIVIDYLPISQIDRKVIVATAGGDPPDVAGVWAYNIPAFADAEALEPLDGFIRRDGQTKEQWLARYYPIFAHLCQHGGHVYGGISTPATIALYWNKTLFREAGLDPDRPPRTLAEFDDDCRRLTRRDLRTGALLQLGFLPQEPGWWPWIFCLWMGGELFDGRNIPNAAWEFIKYINSNNPQARRREELQGSELVCFLQQKICPLRNWSPYFERHHPNPNIRIFRELAASPHAVCTPDLGIWLEYFHEFIAAFERVRLLVAPPGEALTFAQKRISESWTRYRRSLERHGQVPPASGPTPP